MKVEIRNLNKNFGKTQAVKNLNFVIKEFKTIGFVRSKWLWKNDYNWYVAWIN